MDGLIDIANDIKPLFKVDHGTKLNSVIWFQPGLASLILFYRESHVDKPVPFHLSSICNLHTNHRLHIKTIYFSRFTNRNHIFILIDNMFNVYSTSFEF